MMYTIILSFQIRFPFLDSRSLDNSKSLFGKRFDLLSWSLPLTKRIKSCVPYFEGNALSKGRKRRSSGFWGKSLLSPAAEQETSLLLNLSCPPPLRIVAASKREKLGQKLVPSDAWGGRWFPACHTTQCFLAKWCIGKFVLSLADLAKKSVQFKQLNTILPNDIKKLFGGRN